MRVILTHEQADFDALASLLAAYLLEEGAVPVLPRRMNRNVRAFITIYGDELPFVDPRDLPPEPVISICLVDTQSMATLKGVTPDVQVNVIDHHPRRQDLPQDWRITVDETGATVTLLIETLREQNGHLSIVQATLLLLGIYEDTGSLTYSRTTTRDLHAAAYLLEQGASLKIASDFLNHPLSLEQQQLYDELRRVAETHKVYGHTIVIAVGDAQQLEEELSSIAHKLRDLLEPDALFLLVQTRGGIQLITRSTSDQIDVSRVAGTFGGGGHERAAAALIKDQGIDQVYQKLVDVLPQIVRPAISVAQIMSPGPQVMSPDTTASEAAQRMQRYGYEGYPVVQDGKLVGLLTRRAVDRAMGHKLNLTAASLMDAGAFTVFPEDSLENLQRLMAESGWGQIPVVHPETRDIIGIVTRTDILKTMTSKTFHSGRRNLTKRLEETLPPARLALLQAVAQQATNLHTAIYIVGGFVRDLLLDRPSLDFDIVVEGDAIALSQALIARYGGRITTHTRFGTAKWYLEGSTIFTEAENREEIPDLLDLISARTEFYSHPTALPTVERGSIKLDLHRRDFTINTLAIRLDGHHFGDLHDYWGGYHDLQLGLVRVLHSLSFVDDPTRMLRAVRFEQRFGFQIEARTIDLLSEAILLLDRVSGDRIRHELDHILDETKCSQMFSRLESLGLLRGIHHALNWNTWISQRMAGLTDVPPPNILDFQKMQQRWPMVRRVLIYIIWFIRLRDEQIQSVMRRLHYPPSQLQNVLAAARLFRELPNLIGMKPSQIVAQLEDIPLLSVYAVCLAAMDKEACDLLYEYLKNWRHINPSISGLDLKARGLPPGPIYKNILGELRTAWLDGEVTSAAEENVLLERILERNE